MIDDEGREALANALGPWRRPPSMPSGRAPDDERYNFVDEILKGLWSEGFRIIEIERHEDLLEVANAALTVAGAELESWGKERAWEELEAALQKCNGHDWRDAALELINAWRDL